jgi:Chaperone of endosialidase
MMNPLIRFKMTILPLLITFVLGFALVPGAQAIVPPPDGGYPGANTAEGDGALHSITPQARGSGGDNTALGYHTLFSDITGSRNTATGSQALFSNVEGYQNTATGYQALYHNVGSALLGFGLNNVATGAKSLFSNTTGDGNVATGFQALYSNTDGFNNVAVGDNALSFNTTGSNNIAVGWEAGIATTGDDNIIIGHFGEAGEDGTIRIGTQGQHTATYIAGISGTAVSGTAVVVNGAGQLGVAPSSERFKEEIEPMDKSSEAIHALKPVTFRYKKDIDAERTPQFGLVAEEVEKVNPDLVARDDKGKVYTVRYEAVNAMLLNEFLKEHRKVEQLEKKIEALTAGLQKVSAQVELSKPAPQTALKHQ